ncbi:MAG: hypothetical protein ACHQ0J_10500 [Candidatus Dormibacterales bacterium]
MALTISQSGGFTLKTDGLGRVRGGSGGHVVFSASGGTAPYTFALVAGALPPGCSLTTDGVIRSVGTARGAALVRIRAVDSATPPAFVDSDQTVTIS